MKKRIISMFIAIAMVVGLIPTTSAAYATYEVGDTVTLYNDAGRIEYANWLSSDWSVATIISSSATSATVRFVGAGSVTISCQYGVYTWVYDYITDSFWKHVNTGLSRNFGFTVTEPTVKTIVASPAAGAVERGQSVSLSTATSGAAIYYTTDGSTPTIESELYVQPIIIDNPLTIRAIGVRGDLKDSPIMTANYTIAPVSAPQANPTGGLFQSGESISLSTSTAGASIYYTLDGSTPNKNSTPYTTPIVLNNPGMLKAVAFKEGEPYSAVMAEIFSAFGENSPYVLGGFPENGQSELTAVHLITVEFNRNITESTEFGKIKLMHNDASVTGKKLIDGKTLYFVPDKELDLDKTYTFTVPANSVTDGDFYSNSEEYTKSFTTLMKKQTIINPISISAGNSHSMVIDDNGNLWGWGNNERGQLGDRTTIGRHFPVQISGEWSKVSANGTRTLAIKSDGTLWVWGYNHYGLGAAGSSSLYPVQIGEELWTDVSAGSEHTLAIDSESRLWSWGRGDYGQLGNSTYSHNSAPTLIGTRLWSSVSAGGEHSMGIDAEGMILGWGRSSNFGQTGTYYASDESRPTNSSTHWSNPDNPGDWVSVSAGSNHSAAILNNDRLRVVGSNADRQLGLNASWASTNGFTGVSGSWKSVSAGANHTLGIKTDGTLWAWGGNSSGQLGNGGSSTVWSPAQIQTSNEWESVSAGNAYTVAAKSDGTLWAWGNNSVGQLGDGTETNKNTPIQIGFPIPATEVTFGKDEIALDIGQKGEVIATPDGVYDGEIIWFSDNSNIATVERGLITGISGGVTTITALIPGEEEDRYFAASIEVRVGDLIIDVVPVEGNDAIVVEVSNISSKAISTKGLYLTDDHEEPFKWAMPSFIIRPNDSIMISGLNVAPVRIKRGRVNFDIALAGRIRLIDANGDVIVSWDA
ncbi:MAG: chitobiase/beta-hexosaminidase C-terminal domain-containing protein [Oscillospiraceae bacterium]|nr:chitobiase/beta-hexosaminidase C-terminal domain-containing protein [Oscillospiraceae bacterium]